MDEKARQQMAKMVDAVQPHCDEPVVAAMTCSHAGSMSSVLFFKLLGGIDAVNRSSDLPNPVFVAVGATTVRAFDYKPRGFKFKIKREVARWPRGELAVAVEKTDRMAYFTLTTASGDSYPMEVTTVMGAEGVVDLFLEALRGP
jgi:hypothetical protein